MYDLLLLLDMKELDNQAYLSVSFTSKQNLSAERLNSQKLFGFTSLKKNLLSTIICVPNFVAPNYQKVIIDI